MLFLFLILLFGIPTLSIVWFSHCLKKMKDMKKQEGAGDKYRSEKTKAIVSGIIALVLSLGVVVLCIDFMMEIAYM